MTQVFEGWIARSLSQQPFFEWDDCEDNFVNDGTHYLVFCQELEIAQKKGKKENWNEEDYPPVKIKITVEIGE